jgi:transmembrane 9 superfamily member 2/4
VKKATHHRGVVFVVYFALNFALLMEGSSGATPLSTFFTLLFLWFCVSVPLVFIGSDFGDRAEVPIHPVTTNQMPRLIVSGRVRKGDGEIELLPRRMDLALTRSRW